MNFRLDCIGSTLGDTDAGLVTSHDKWCTFLRDKIWSHDDQITMEEYGLGLKTEMPPARPS